MGLGFRTHGARFDEIVRLQQKIFDRLGQIMSALDDLKAEVEATATVEQSAVTLIQGIADQLAAALAASANPDPALVDLTTQLTASTSALAAAVAANTAPPPAPTPTP